MSKLSDEDRAGLSPQEIEALEDDDTPGGINDLPNEPQLSAEELDDEQNDAETLAAKEKADAEAKVAADAKAAADAKEEGDDKIEADASGAKSDPADDKLFAPTYRADAVEDYDKKIEDLTTAFEKGDIQLAQFNKERDVLVRAQTKAEIAEESKKQNLEQRWDWEIDRFMDDAREQKELGNIDYRANKILQASLDAAVKDLASKEENANKSGRWYLTEAHKQVMANFGRTATEKTADEKAAETAAAEALKKAGRRPDLKAVPKTLGGLPAASPSETGSDSEFSHLEKLDGMSLERAIAKMTPEQQDRYAQNG